MLFNIIVIITQSDNNKQNCGAQLNRINETNNYENRTIIVKFQLGLCRWEASRTWLCYWNFRSRKMEAYWICRFSAALSSASNIHAYGVLIMFRNGDEDYWADKVLQHSISSSTKLNKANWELIFLTTDHIVYRRPYGIDING